MATYTRGQQIRFTVTVTDSAAALGDPTGVVFRHTTPDGTVTVQTYPADAEPIRDSLGVFHVDLTLSNVGSHDYRWEASGDLIGAVEQKFDVKASAFS